MDSYSSLGVKIAKMLESQAKCGQFSRHLRRSIIGEDQSENFTVIDESSLVTVEVQQKRFYCPSSLQTHSPQKLMNFNNQSHVFKNRDINCNTFVGQNNSVSKHKKTSEIDQENEFIQHIPNKQPQVFSRADFSQQRAQNTQEFVLAQKETFQFEQIQEEYFQLNILNEQTQSDSKNIKLHQVKIFPKNDLMSNQSFHNDAFNLSNFSSFNGINSHQNLDSQSMKAESEFYQKEFVYLIKKIEMVQGRKLSQKGIQKVVNQLQLLLPENALAQISLNQIQPHKLSEPSKTKRVPKLNFTKKTKTQNIEKLNSDSNTDKKVKYETNIESELKSKSKIKNSNSQISSKFKHYSNKQNIKIDQKLKQVKESDRSTSPLSYRVLMQKKKCQKQKSQQRKNKIQAVRISNKQPTNDPKSTNDFFNQSFTKSTNRTKVDRSLQCQKESTQESDLHKKNRLKIILENSSQNKMKTLSFEYSSTGINLHKEVENYCMKNKIQSKNIKSICQALSQNKPIITIKQ